MSENKKSQWDLLAAELGAEVKPAAPKPAAPPPPAQVRKKDEGQPKPERPNYKCCWPAPKRWPLPGSGAVSWLLPLSTGSN